MDFRFLPEGVIRSLRSFKRLFWYQKGKTSELEIKYKILRLHA